MKNYEYILLFAAMAFFMASIGIGLSYLFSHKKVSKAKNMPYECGFLPKNKVFTPFDIKYYLIAVLFVIFEVEIVLLIPFAIALKSLTFAGVLVGSTVLLLLIVGLIYELKKGVLDWH